MVVRVQSEPFNVADELKQLKSDKFDIGAEVSFTGIVRDDGELQFLEIEHYPAMTESAINAIVAEAKSRWDVKGCVVIHRYGKLSPGDQIMMVATASSHRKDAFESAEFLMDYLKSRAPFWKKEITKTGEGWVAAKDSDEDALDRW